MKTLDQKIKEVREIKWNNFLVKNRIEALETAGYEYAEIHPRDFDKDKYYYEYIHCSRDWNRTYGYAVIKYTFNVVFNDDYDSNDLGMDVDMQDAIEYIKSWNGTEHSYFKDYKTGTVSVVCNETGNTVYHETVF